jgi:hypothetical protein
MLIDHSISTGEKSHVRNMIENSFARKKKRKKAKPARKMIEAL